MRLRFVPPTLALALIVALATPAGALEVPPTENAATVNNEADYRAALSTLSADTSGAHTITIGESFFLSDGTDPTYTGTQPLTIEGQGFTIDAMTTSRILSHQSTALLTIRNLTLDNARTPAGNDGGAVTANGPVVIEGSTFEDNAAFSNGGAIEAQNGAVTISDSRFLRNTAENIAGAVEAGGGLLTITGSEFTANTVDDPSFNSGGGSALTAEAAEITDTTFTDNRVVDASSGGAVRLDDDSVLTRTTFTDNTAEIDGGAGAVSFTRGELTIADSVFTGNTSVDSDGGAIDALSGTTLIVTNSVLRSNVADGGNGGAIKGDTVRIQSSILADNQATGGGKTGGAIEGTDVTIQDSTLTGNSSSSSGGAVSGTAVVDVRNTTITANTSIGGAGGVQTSTGLTRLRHATVVGNEGATVGNVVAETLQTFGTVIAAPIASSNCLIGLSTTSTYSYDDDGTCGLAGIGDKPNGDDPLLGTVRNNGDTVATTEVAGTGAPRPSMFPLNDSPLVDAIPAEDCASAAFLDLDQRGVDRPFDTGCDIGAVEAVFPAHGFTDVTPFYEATVRWITSAVNTPNILDGYDNGTFRQTLNITRGQTARMYYRAAGQPDVSGLDPHGFTDVTDFFDDAVTWAKDSGIFDGYDDNTFRQADPITRGNYVRSLYGFAQGDLLTDPGPHGFSDVTDFYEAAVRWAKANGLADGYDDNTFRQRNNITRGNATRIMYNLARTKVAWGDIESAPPNMLFKDNLATSP